MCILGALLRSGKILSVATGGTHSPAFAGGLLWFELPDRKEIGAVWFKKRSVHPVKNHDHPLASLEAELPFRWNRVVCLRAVRYGGDSPVE